MTDGIGRIFGGNSYGVNGYVSRKNDDSKKEASEQQLVNNQHEGTQIEPSKVMEFLSSSNIFVASTDVIKVGELDTATQERVAGYMENFEMIYGAIVNEFGEKFASEIMNLYIESVA